MMSPDESAKKQVIALIPVQGKPLYRELLGGKPLLVHTLKAALESRSVDRVVVTTEDEEMAELARGEGAETPFLRPKELAGPHVPLERVLQHAVEWLEENEGRTVDIVVLLEVTHPFRPPGLIDKIVETISGGEWDSVFVAHEETDNFWSVGQGGLMPIGEEGHAPRSERKPIYREISGMVCATRGEVLKRGDRLGYRVGMVPIRGMSGKIDVRSKLDLEMAEALVPAWEASLGRNGGGKAAPGGSEH
jgi:CMP-N-acetylneuraminic acid synthetase